MSPRQPIAPPPLYIQPDALKGRGSAWAMPHRFESREREQFDDGWGTLDQQAQEETIAPRTEVIEEHAKRVLSSNQSPDISFDFSVNPYRGCEHGCIYCFARPTHSYLNMSPGLDFETRIVAKVNAAQRLRETFAHPSYEPRPLCIGTATDAYQPVERKLGITRAIVELMAEAQHPFSMVTKSSGVERDLDVLTVMAQRRQVSIYVSVTTLDPELARTLEPRAAAPQRRLRTIRTLADAGVPVGVSVSPLIPFLNEPELERILEAAAEAGARRAFSIPLRLPWEVAPLFHDWLRLHQPAKAARIMARLRDMRGGKDNDPNFGTRMTGEGLWAQLLQQRMKKAVQRLGLGRERFELDFGQFRRPAATAGQGELF